MELIIIVSGIIVIFQGILKIKKYNTAKSTYVLTQGIVTEIERVRRHVYTAVLTYTVNNVVYKIRKGAGRVGQQCGVYYNPNDPSDAVAEGNNSGVASIIAGVVVIFLGIFFYYHSNII